MPSFVALVFIALLDQAAGSAPVVTGRVVDSASHAPLAGARVLLFVQGQPPSPLPNRAREATTDADGRFSFDDVAPGTYRVLAERTGYALPFGPRPAPTTVVVQAGVAAAPVEIALERAGAIAGRITDGSGEPLAQVRVTALRRLGHVNRPPNAPPLVPAGAGAQTNDLGEFRLFNLPAGEYLVQAQPPFDRGAATAPLMMVETFFPGTTEAEGAQRVVVAAGQTVANIDIRMLTAKAFSISGVVVDEAGAPVAGAMLQLTRDSHDTPFPPRLGPLAGNRTDQAGRFTLTNVRAGTYALVAMPPVALADASPRAGAPDGGAVGGVVAGGVGASAWSTFDLGNGRSGGMVTTETVNGRTTQFRESDGTRVSLTIEDANVNGVQIVVRRPASR